jgi:hypothetical protein
MHVRESGQFLTARDLAESFNLNLVDFQPQLIGRVTRGEIFSICDESAGELFPVFAFERTVSDIRPLEAISEALSIVGHSLSSWAIASWLIGLNSYLDDQCPKDLIDKDPEWVIKAARDAISECAHG